MDKPVPQLPECQRPAPTVADASQKQSSTNSLTTNKDKDENTGRSSALMNSTGMSTKASFRAWISTEEDCQETGSELDTKDSEIDVLVMNRKNFHDLATLIAWEKEEEMKIERQTSLTRQRPTSSLNASGCLVEEIMASSSPFRAPTHHTSSVSQEIASPFSAGAIKTSKEPLPREDSTQMENDYVVVPNTTNTVDSSTSDNEKVSLKNRIMWKLKKLRKRQARKTS